MAFKSHSQRRYYESLVFQGKMTKEDFNRHAAETPPDSPVRKLPERIGTEKQTKTGESIWATKVVPTKRKGPYARNK